MEWILASASPRRRELLGRMGIPFRVEVADVVEWESGDSDPACLVLHNAELKADAVSRRFPDAFVLGADTTVCIDGLVLNKPVDMDDAARMLNVLQGRKHQVFTAVALRSQIEGVSHAFVERSDVFFKPLDADAIQLYFQRVDPLDKAGAYGIQEGGELIIDRHAGSWTNIMGLPIERLEDTLRHNGWWPRKNDNESSRRGK